MTNLAPGRDDRVDVILSMIQTFSGGNFQYPANLVKGQNELDVIIESLNTLGQGLHTTNTYLAHNQQRIDKILDVLMSYTMSDFSIRAEISDAGDELDAIALGLNTLAEELAAAKSNEQKYIAELEMANDELRSFSYIASHDLQEPLRNIKIFSNLLAERELDKLSDRGKQLIDKINGSAGRMQKLIDDLLAFSRTQTYKNELVDVDLNAVFNEIVNNYKESLGDGKFNVDVQKLPTVVGVAFQFRQLIDNLVSNALKYSKPDVSIEIKVKSELVNGESLIAEGAESGRKYYRVAIKDNGIGFEPEYSKRIFEIFQRLHGRDEYSGTGIGLAICKKIVQNHKGFIYAESEPGKGAAFFICLPA